MEFIKDTDPDVLKTKTSSSAILFFLGLLSFACACFIISTSVVLKGPQGQGYVIFGVMLMMGGTLYMFGRVGFTMEKRTNTIRKWYGLLIPMIIRKYALNDFKRVLIYMESKTYIVYTVRLVGDDGVKNLKLTSPKDYRKAKTAAERVAKFLSVPISDFTSGKEIIWEHDKLNESVAERVKSTGEKVELPPKPIGAISTITETGDQVIIDIPPQGFNRRYLLLLLLPVFFFLYVFCSLWPQLQTRVNWPHLRLFSFFSLVFFYWYPWG